jgi:hypothetical protein
MNPLTVLPLLFTQASAGRLVPFFDAIRKGEAVQVSALLAADPALAGDRNADGATPALWAAYTRHPELAAVVAEGQGRRLARRLIRRSSRPRQARLLR